MRSALLILMLICSCGDNYHDPAVEISGPWTYLHGDGRYFCDDGQAGTLSVNAGSVATIARDDDDPSRVRIFYEGECKESGFSFAQGDEQPEEGWISQADRCEYDGQNAFGSFHTTLINTSDSRLYLSEDGETLKDVVEHSYTFAYEDFTQRCQVFSVGYAKRYGADGVP